jgi:hypothetical protein
MPTLNNYFIFIMINLAFMAQVLAMAYFRSAADIKENWPLYRCNPPYWVFSENISDDFTYCVQNTQVNTMGYLLQPITYLVANLTSFSGDLAGSLNNVRQMIGGIRGFTGNIIQNIFGVFLNLVVEFQKMIITIKDMVGKMIGVVMTILYVLDGSIKTMHSTWNGPPGQLVKSIGSCFHPETKIKVKSGETYAMKDLPLGVELCDGGKVFAVLKVDNVKKEPLYKIKDIKNINNTNNNTNKANKIETIYVTGNHFILDPITNKFIKVKNYKDAELQTDVYSDWFSCLITTNRRIKIGKHIFWDWEDDELTKC